MAPAVRAQQGERMRRIGVLLPATADDTHYQTWLGAFLQGLSQSGWNIGQNVRIDLQWATANADAVRRNAAELAALAPDVILGPAPPLWGRYYRRPARCRSYSRWSLIPSARAS